MSDNTLDPNRDTKQFNARLPGYILELIDQIADMTGMTKTQIVINALDQYADKIREQYDPK